MTNDFDIASLDELLYKIELDANPQLTQEEWVLVIEALEYYKESFKVG